jgi:hypothetical protein
VLVRFHVIALFGVKKKTLIAGAARGASIAGHVSSFVWFFFA